MQRHQLTTNSTVESAGPPGLLMKTDHVCHCLYILKFTLSTRMVLSNSDHKAKEEIIFLYGPRRSAHRKFENET
jgi:hypothetical protein